MKNEQWILSKRPIGVPNLETDLKSTNSSTIFANETDQTNQFI